MNAVSRRRMEQQATEAIGRKGQVESGGVMESEKNQREVQN